MVRLTTIKDVARRAGVSPTTVSATFNGSAPVSEALKARVRAVAEELNYRPDPLARTLRRGTTTTIGFVVPDVAIPWASHLARAVQRALAERGYTMLLASNEDDPNRELQDIAVMTDNRVAGLIVAPTSHGIDYAERLTLAVRCPAVLVDRVVAPDHFDAVVDDNALGGLLIANYLHRLGHRRIGFLVGRSGISSSDERHIGLRDALAHLRIPLDPQHVRHGIHTVEGAYCAVQDIMSNRQRPTALVCLSNPSVRGAMAGLLNMGLRVPEEVSLASFDGYNPPEGWSPQITCLQQDAVTIGEHAVELLLGRIAREEPSHSETIRVKPRLFIGTSCRNVRNSSL